MTFSSDGKQFAMAGTHETGTRVIVWDLASDKPRHTLESPSCYVGADGDFSPDGRFLAVAALDLDVWELNTEKRLSGPFVGNSTGVEAIACLGQSDAVATLTSPEDDPIQLWEARTGRQKTMIRCRHGANNPGANALAVSPDGRLLACFDNTDKGAVRIWDAGTGKQVRELAGRSRIEEAPWLRFSADGKLLAVASRDGKARVWNVANGNLLSESGLQFGPTAGPPDHAYPYKYSFLQRVFFPDLDCVVLHGSFNEPKGAERDKFHVFSVQTGKECGRSATTS